ncbi:amino acid transporter-like protein [Cadophora sp. DSE1049]|nr:amino acid transporter-like protein [Cadophora sp. DSE1049]
MPPNPETDADAAQLAALGHKSELNRNFSPLAMLGLAFAILNSWTALAASLSLALPSGGPTSVLWGLITAGICNLALAVSLAEFLSAYPTAGGQYHWVAVISWKPWVPLLSWITGWINVSGWIALICSGGLLGSQLIIGVISLMHPDFVPHRWHQFLIYIGYTLVAFVVNAFLTGALPIITRTAFIWSITGFVVISITVLACVSPNYTSAEYVFTEFINETGWPDGIAWLLGLLQGGLALTGFDAVAHMIEEIPNAAVVGPRIMYTCVLIGVFTGFIFLMVLLFVAGQIDGPDGVIESTAGPLLQIFYNATGNKAGAICLLIFPLMCLLFATTSIMTTSSRMTYAFARDGGLPISRVFAKVHPRLGLPLNALYLNVALVLIFGCIFLGSSSAFNAIISASVVALGVSYGIPIAINCIRGRGMLPETRPFRLSPLVGWTANLIGIVYVIITTVLFLFPPELPVTGTNMNYCVVVFFIILVISIVQWFVDGKKNFTGPRVNLDDLQNGTVVGMDPTTSADQRSSSNMYKDGPDMK